MKEIKLRDFLNEGTIIRTKHSDSPNWSTNIVYGINDESIEIDMGLEKEYIENIIMVGDPIKFKHTTNEAEYTVIGWVTRINTDSPQSITIKVHQIQDFSNNRDSYRYDVYLSSVIRMKSESNKCVFAVLMNISKTGCAFIVRDDIEKLLDIDSSKVNETQITIDFYVAPDNLISLDCMIVRKTVKEKGIEYGVRIIDMSIENEKKLMEFINQLENMDREFYNKRSGFWSKNSKFNKPGDK